MFPRVVTSTRLYPDSYATKARARAWLAVMVHPGMRTPHVVVIVVVFAIEVAIPLHALEVGLIDRVHWRALLRVAQDVGPDIDAVLGGLPDLHPTLLGRRVVLRRGSHRARGHADPHLALRYFGLEGALLTPLLGQATSRLGVKRPAVQRAAHRRALHATLAEWAAFVGTGVVEGVYARRRAHQGDSGRSGLHLPDRSRTHVSDLRHGDPLLRSGWRGGGWSRCRDLEPHPNPPPPD